MTRKVNKEKRNDKINHILQVAKTVFSEKGFDGARTDEIADRAGMSKIGMYYYIGDKKTLYASVLKEMLVYAEKYVVDKINNDSSPEDNFKKVIRGIAEIADKNNELHAILLRELISGGDNIPSELPEAIAKDVEAIKKILDNGKKQKVFGDADPLVIFFILMSFFVYWKFHLPIMKKINPKSKLFENGSLSISDKVVDMIEMLLFKMLKP
ncbi:MAG: TetR/AcrR family transcriptional regulator [Pseudomonadota bacterium]